MAAAWALRGESTIDVEKLWETHGKTHGFLRTPWKDVGKSSLHVDSIHLWPCLPNNCRLKRYGVPIFP